jgi:integrase
MVKQRGKAGVWYARIEKKGATGKRRQHWVRLSDDVKSERAARKEEARLITEMAAGALIDPTKQRLGDFMEEWLTGIKPRLEARTIETYEGIVRRQILPHLGAVPLSKLTANQIRATLATLLESGRRDGKGGLDPATVERVHSVLKQALQQAVDDERIGKNPAAKVKPPRPQRKEMIVLNEAEVALLLAAAEKTPTRTIPLHLAILLLATTGLRRNEALGLRWQDTDLERGLITVNQTLVQINGQGVRAKPTAKNDASRRTLKLPAVTVEALSRHREEQFARRQQLGEAYQDQGLILERGDGTPVRPTSFSNAVADVARAAGLPDIHVHSLRHSHISQLIAQRPDPKAIQMRAGHSKIQTTYNTYGHLFPGHEDTMVEQFDATFRAAMDKIG